MAFISIIIYIYIYIYIYRASEREREGERNRCKAAMVHPLRVFLLEFILFFCSKVNDELAEPLIIDFYLLNSAQNWQVNPKMILTLSASIMYWSLQRSPKDPDPSDLPGPIPQRTISDEGEEDVSLPDGISSHVSSGYASTPEELI